MDYNGSFVDCSKMVEGFCEDDLLIVCHQSKSLLINKSILSAHVEHGDTIGPCKIVP